MMKIHKDSNLSYLFKHSSPVPRTISGKDGPFNKYILNKWTKQITNYFMSKSMNKQKSLKYGKV